MRRVAVLADRRAVDVHASIGVIDAGVHGITEDDGLVRVRPPLIHRMLARLPTTPPALFSSDTGRVVRPFLVLSQVSLPLSVGRVLTASELFSCLLSDRFPCSVLPSLARIAGSAGAKRGATAFTVVPK